MKKPKIITARDFATFDKIPTTREQIKLRSVSGNIVIPTKQIIYLEAAVNYTLVHTRNNGTFLSSRTIKYYEDLLDKMLFLRIHKSYIINLSFIKEGKIGRKNREIKLACGTQLEVSRRRLKEIIERSSSI